MGGSSTGGAGDYGCESVVALDIVEDVEDAHAHAVLAPAVHVPLHLHSSSKGEFSNAFYNLLYNNDRVACSGSGLATTSE